MTYPSGIKRNLEIPVENQCNSIKCMRLLVIRWLISIILVNQDAVLNYRAKNKIIV